MGIELSDLGSSLPVGGVLIGALRPDTGEFQFQCLEVPLFQGRPYANFEHYFAAADLSVQVLDALQVPTDEPVAFGGELGRREVLTRLQGEFSDVQRLNGGLRLKQLLAEALQNQLKTAYGCEIDLETLADKPGLAFYKAIEWAKGGSPYKINAVLPEREVFCKTGWPSWRLWADNLYPEAKKIAAALRETRQAQFEAGRSGPPRPKPAPVAGKPGPAVVKPGPAVVKPGVGEMARPISDREWEEKYGDSLPF